MLAAGDDLLQLQDEWLKVPEDNQSPLAQRLINDAHAFARDIEAYNRSMGRTTDEILREVVVRLDHLAQQQHAVLNTIRHQVGARSLVEGCADLSQMKLAPLPPWGPGEDPNDDVINPPDPSTSPRRTSARISRGMIVGHEDGNAGRAAVSVGGARAPVGAAQKRKPDGDVGGRPEKRRS